MVGVEAVDTANDTVGAVVTLTGSGWVRGMFSLECLGDEQASGPI